MASKDQDAREQLEELLREHRYISSRTGRERRLMKHHRQALAAFIVEEKDRVRAALELTE